MDQDAGITDRPGSGRPAGRDFLLSLDEAIDRVVPGLTIAESFAVTGAAPRELAARLRARVCPGALARAHAGGWSLDWPEAPALGQLWPLPDIPPDPGESPRFPTDEEAASCLRLLDGVALRLGLGRGHVLPLYENPARRAVELEAFCDLPSLSREAVIARVAEFLDLGVPLGAALGISHQGDAGWAGFRPDQRWSKILLSPRGEGLRDRLPEEFLPAQAEGFAILLARPVAGGVAVDLPAGLDLAALAALLAALSATAADQEVGLVVEGAVAGPGLIAIGLVPEAAGLRVTLPPRPAGRAAVALLDGVSDCLAGLGARLAGGPRHVRLQSRGAGMAHGLRNLLAAMLRHPALIALGQGAGAGLGPFSAVRRPDEQPGRVGAALTEALSAPPEDLLAGRIARLLEGSHLALDAGGGLTITLAGGEPAAGISAWQALLAAAVLLPPPQDAPAAPLWPPAAHALPAILAADLAALLAELAAIGLVPDGDALRARLDALCPVLCRIDAGHGPLEIRRGLTDRQLPGGWQAVTLELRLPGGHASALALAVPGGEGWRPVPLIDAAGLRLGRVTLPLAPATEGPCAGLFPPGGLDLALSGDGGAVAFGLRADPDWMRVEAVAIPPPAAMPAPAPEVGADHPGLVAGI
ncbi:MAG: hypothetical protein KatS3mg118_2719 [Paracoccaceae bacterium]|nr:MAG: hypothetical protein KatS3mg118_2719 [Paracoccaceae bacterium]